MNKKRSVRTSPWTVAITAIAPLAGCTLSTAPGDPLDELPRELSASEQQVVASSNQFAFDLFRTLAAGQAAENVLVSPLSASMALGMAMNGARGETFEQMQAVLGFSGLPQEEINGAYRGLMDLLPGLDPDTETMIANAIWHDQGFVMEPAFVSTLRESFDADVASLDFADSRAPDRINDWVSSATRQRIPTIVEDIPDDAVTYLINAIYFKGAWRERFDPARTRDDRFVTGAGSEIAVKMMNRDDSIALSRGAGFQAVDLPYGNGAFSMTLLLPDEGGDLDAVIRSLSPQSWGAMTAAFAESRMMLELPRMSFEVTHELKAPLKEMGMTVPFMGGMADFSGMSTLGPKLYISDVVHKTFIEVDEEGTEAAAATSVGVSVTSMPPILRFDRPFILAIRERLSGTIMFIGRVNNPIA